jgi:hypothetical protein|tara:strand:- start:3533 stop:4051 length:519 start_codon:yes stop_codon:yes gene_type:complete
VEYSDAVELWARGRGGHAKLKWLPDPMNCWAVILSYRAGDPRQASPEDGEPVLLHDWKDAKWWHRYHPERVKRHERSNEIMPCGYAYELDELGVSGILERLDRGNILSGRGEFDSAEEAGRKQVEKFKDEKHKRRLDARGDAGHRARDIRRQVMKIPFLPVGVEFTKGKEAS